MRDAQKGGLPPPAPGTPRRGLVPEKAAPATRFILPHYSGAATNTPKRKIKKIYPLTGR